MVVQSTVGLAAAFSRPPETAGGAAASRPAAGGHRMRGASSDGASSLLRPARGVPVFFAGGFLARNPMAQALIGRSFKRLTGTSALFLQHSDFLGALGAVGSTI